MPKRLPIFICFAIWITSCASPASSGAISLSDLKPLEPVVSPDILPLRVAVANVISPTGTLESYTPLVRYLGRKLGRPVELLQRRTYAETNELILRGEADLAFVCTSAYVAGHEDFGMELLAAPVVNGDTVYYSVLIVPSDSEAESIDDLRGKTFAFTDPMSNSGRLYPNIMVHELGETPEHFFSNTFFTYSHDDAILSVAQGVADGAAVDSLVLEFTLARNPELAEQIRIIHFSPPFGIPPVVVGPEIRPQLQEELEEALLQMHLDTEGQKALSSLDIERFVLIEDNAYDTVREMVSALEMGENSAR